MPSFLEYSFMQHALISWVLISLLCPILGIFLIIRRYTLISDTLAHSSLSGIILGLVSGINPLISTLMYTTASAFIIEKFRLSKKLSWDMVLAIFLTLNMSFVAIALSLNSRVMLNISSYLFWSISLVTEKDTSILACVFIIVLWLFLIFRKELMITTYDEDAARASGVSTKKIHIVFMLIVGMTIAVAFPIVWVLLLSSLLILPVLAASQIAKSFTQTLVFAEIFSCICVISGIIFSYYSDISASGTIGILLVLCFFMCFFIGQMKKQIR